LMEMSLHQRSGNGTAAVAIPYKTGLERQKLPCLTGRILVRKPADAQ
jgi:hypothetical protein